MAYYPFIRGYYALTSKDSSEFKESKTVRALLSKKEG